MLWTLKEVSRQLGVSVRSVLRLIQRRELPLVRVKRQAGA